MLEIDVRTQLDGEALAEAWKLYETRMGVMAPQAAQTHLLSYGEFADVCMNPRIELWRLLDTDDDQRCVALAAFTNDLGSWPYVSAPFFAARWRYASLEQCLWYCGFVVVDDPAPQGAFVTLITGMYRHVADYGGVIALDFAEVNSRLARVVDVVLARAAKTRDPAGASPVGYRGRCVDSQDYWVYETAVPKVDLPAQHRPASAGGADRGEAWGTELVLDLHGCDLARISDGDLLREFAGLLVQRLGMTAHGEPVCERFALHDPDKAGYSLVQLITTSSITCHFAERSRTAFINIFSCKPFDIDDTTRYVTRFFDASDWDSHVVTRRVRHAA